MIKRFFEGLVYGLGFSIAFVIIWSVASYVIYPRLIESSLEMAANDHLPGEVFERPTVSGSVTGTGMPFHEMDIEDEIQESSVIVRAEYEPTNDGKMKAIIKEFLKKDPTVKFYYEIGNEHPMSSYYPRENTSYGDGLIIFFAGSPAVMKMSMSYDGGRIGGLGDLPLELLRQKCATPNA